MKGTNFFPLKNIIRCTLVTMIAFLTNFTTVQAQGTCACKGHVQVSVDENCDAEITTDMILASGTSCGTGIPTLTIMKTPTSGVIAVGSVGSVILEDATLYIGKTLYVKVTEASGINSCWSTISIEDKLAPTIDCPGDVTMTCYQLASYTPIVTENCSHYKVNLVSETITVNDCNMSLPEDVLKVINRQYQAVDESGNKSDICEMSITVTGIPALAQPTFSIPASRLLLANTHLECDADYAKIPVGKPFAGNPSPENIGTKPGTGAPSLLLWTPTVVGSGTINQGLTTNMVQISTGATGANTQVCLIAHKDTTISFNFVGSTGAIGQLLINNIVTSTLTGSGSRTNISVSAGDQICFRNTVANTTLTISSTRMPRPFYLSLLEAGDLYCNLYASYSDVRLPNIGCVTKIIRTWRVLEWSCRTVQRSAEFVQMIEIADKVAPEFTCPAQIWATTNGHDCNGTVLLPSIDGKDNCSANVTVDIIYPGGILKNKNGGLAPLPVGCHTVQYVVYDDCYNSSTCNVSVVVEDKTAPTVICKQSTVVSLTLDGKAWVPAASFDNGSFDECQLSKVLVRRMTSRSSTDCTPCKAPEFSGFTHLGEYSHTGSQSGNHHYYISKHKASPEVAQRTADAMGGHLVVLDNAAEDKWVYDEVQKWNLDENYIIGLRDVKLKNIFNWVNGSTATYRNWGFEQPEPLKSGDENSEPYVLMDVEDYDWYTFGSDVCDATEFLYVIEINDPCGFSEYVGFCCKDVGTSPAHQVVVRAIDKAGNYNDCMVNVEIQDKLPPSIICPANVTLTCEDYFDVAKLAHTFGWPTALDNCENPRITTDSVVNLNSCRIGTIVRTFTATDLGGRKATCTQHITIEQGDNAFDMDVDDFPRDTTFSGCADPNANAFHPDRTGRPNLGTETICALVGADYEDHLFTFNNPTGNACFKILRKWKVIDWCQRYFDDGGYHYKTWEHTQVIIVSDSEKPRITSDCGKKTAKTYDSECKDGYIELLATATDNCSRTLDYHYQIDEFNDGSFDSGLSKSGSGNTAIASGVYPVGTHKIVWAFEDNCGNITKCEQIFEIINEKTPVPYCLNGLSTSLMPVDTDNDGDTDGGMIDIWAKDFDRGSLHPCGYPVILSFRPVTRNATTGKLVVKDSLIFRCSHEGRQNVDLYAAVELPDGRIIQDFCTTYIDIQDNNNVCGSNGTNNRIAGMFMTEGDSPVKNVTVALDGSAMKVLTTENGQYAFEQMNTGGTYIVMPEKNDDHANGVSTLDLVMIQRHILGLKKLESPYKLIAADVNKDAKITAVDLTELRKVVLGTTLSFPNNESWRFVDKKYNFQNPSTAYAEAFPEVNYIPNFEQDVNIDFTAIKVGDVNGNVVANAQDGNIENRSATSMAIQAVDQTVAAGEVITVPMTLTSGTTTSGFQFTVNFDADAFSLVNVTGGIQGMADQNFGFARLEDGMIAVSYNRADNAELPAGQKVIELTLKAKTATTIAEALWIDSAVTPAEAYDEDDNVMKVEFNVEGRTNTVAMLYQNTPNPFKATTIIGFDLPEANTATINIYDVTGKIVKSITGTYAKGYNSLEINKAELGTSGMMYYTLESGTFKATRKMIIIE
jgi:hypothetical protein